MILRNASNIQFDTLDEILQSIGAVGARICDIDASEGASGNISVLYSWRPAPDARFAESWVIPSPVAVPSLEGAWIAVTGSGRRLREVEQSTGANVALVEVLGGGETLRIHAAPNHLFEKPTSELNTHLALHARHAEPNGPIHTVLHAQPLHLTFLSHIASYREGNTMNTKLLRWQPELIIQLFDGIGVAPYLVPGSEDLMRATLALSERHRVVVWSQHGAITHVSGSVKKAGDLIEYAETGARYEFLNLQSGQLAQGIPLENLRKLCEEFGVAQTALPDK